MSNHNHDDDPSDSLGAHPFGYRVIRFLFDWAAFAFYTRIEVDGMERIPRDGTPTIINFNHSNSLADSIVLISAIPRMIRFCAKDTLWDIPFIGALVNSSGALPIFRKQEHASDLSAMEQNLHTFRAVRAALLQGQCVGLAPEGKSTYVSYIEPLKKGTAFLALDAVEDAVENLRDEDFKLNVVNIGITYTHREKFRSNVCVRVGEPMVLDASWVNGQRFAERKDAAVELTNRFQNALGHLTVNSPDWETVTLAITASRLHQPLGTLLTLSEYTALVGGWVELLKIPLLVGDRGEIPDSVVHAQHVNDATVEKIRSLRRYLAMYQRLLNANGIKDERVRRVHSTGASLTWGQLAFRLSFRLVVGAVLFGLSVPGQLLWLPVRAWIKYRERQFVKKGAYWMDTIAEYKMMLGFLYMVVLLVLFNVAFPLVVVFSWGTLRLYEESVASFRSFRSLVQLAAIPDRRMGSLVRVRGVVKKKVDELTYFLPERVTELSLRVTQRRLGEAANPSTLMPAWWKVFNFGRRQQKDYNEILRFQDYTSVMDAAVKSTSTFRRY